MTKAVRCIVTGHVQGVFFRDSTRRVAESLGVRGHAVNLPDGSVEVVAAGSAAAIDSLHRWLHQGPARSRVDAVRCTVLESEVSPGFRIG